MSFKRHISRITIFLLGAIVLMPATTFAGTLTDVSVTSDNYQENELATYSFHYTVETAVTDVTRLLFADLYSGEVNFGTGQSITYDDVSVTVNGVPQTVFAIGFNISLVLDMVPFSLPAGAEVVVTLHNVKNPLAGTYTFTSFQTSDGTEFDAGTPNTIIITPILSESVRVHRYTSDTTPSYTFTSEKAGTITYGGSCSSDTTEAVVGTNTIVFDELEEGTYSDCTLTLEYGDGDTSSALHVSTFTVDTTAPVIEQIKQIPTNTLANLAIYRYRVISDEINDPVATPPVGPVGGLEIHINETDTPGEFEAYLTGVEPGGPYSFTLYHRDQAGNHSGTLTVGPFYVVNEFKGGGSIITPASGDTQTLKDTNTPIETTTPTPTPEKPKAEEAPAVVPEKIKYVFSVDITPRRKNNEKDVRALQTFLNQYEGEKLTVTGIYNAETIAAVNRFQRKYASEILAPWGIDYVTGNVGIYTRKKIQAIMKNS